jgi:hypothetical protein
MFGNPLLDVAICGGAARFLIGPFAVRFTNSAAAHPRMLPIPAEQVPPDVRVPLLSAESQIRALGFESVGYVHMQANMPNVDTYFVYLLNRSTRTRALAAHMATATKSVGYIGFYNVFSDDSELNTINSKTAGAFKPDPERPAFHFPSVQDPGTLLKIHSRLLQERAALKTSVLPTQGRELDAMIQNWNRTFQRQVQLGYYYLDAPADRYRPTMFGAIAMTWKLAWPVGMIRAWFAKNRGESQLRRLGVA